MFAFSKEKKLPEIRWINLFGFFLGVLNTLRTLNINPNEGLEAPMSILLDTLAKTNQKLSPEQLEDVFNTFIIYALNYDEVNIDLDKFINAKIATGKSEAGEKLRVYFEKKHSYMANEIHYRELYE